ncbi:hypothetical protein F511_09415 [Dorcoceras hygrometricum]|uniref:Uncharacterized protein n=1 Tax=Dorcoceras hygrometricum TaxID=472368 RepID=A0A2Z7BGV6_9LAMI|nr:hypothetical protein F511_09415 [Dorcoceras hygrometricum]
MISCSYPWFKLPVAIQISRACFVVIVAQKYKGTQVLQLVVVLTQLVVPQEVVSVSQLRMSSLASLVGRASVDIRCLMHSICILSYAFFCYISCSPYWGLTPCPSGAWFVSLFVLFPGNPGFTAGRGFNPAGGAPGGG